MTATPAAMRLDWLVLGPRSQGRSYGVLRAPGGQRLPDAIGARLDDLALSISAWAKRSGDSFVALLPLDPESGHRLLLRCAYIGQAELGPVAMALGVLLSPEELARLHGRPHRLLRYVPRPTARAADEAPIDIDPDAPYPAIDVRALQPYAAALDEGPVRIEADDPVVVEPLLCGLLEAANARRVAPTWATTSALTRSGRIDPSVVDLVVAAPAETAPRPGEVWRRFARGAFVDPPPTPRLARSLWGRLFQVDRASLARDLSGDADALAALESVAWDPSYAGLDGVEAIRRCLGEAFARLGSAEPAFQLLKASALQAHRLADPAMKQAACRGIALAFEDLMHEAPPALAAEWLRRYVPIATNMLTDAPPALAARIALDHEALPLMDPALIRVLAGQGLTTLFARATQRTVSGGLGRDAARVAPLLEGLAETLAGQGDAEAGPIDLLAAIAALEGTWPADAQGEAARRAMLHATTAALSGNSPANALARLPTRALASLAIEPVGDDGARLALLDRCAALIDAPAAAPGAWAAAMAIALDAVELADSRGAPR